MEPNPANYNQKRRRKVSHEEENSHADDDPTRTVSNRRALVIPNSKKSTMDKRVLMIYSTIPFAEDTKEHVIFTNFGTFSKFMNINSYSLDKIQKKIGILFDKFGSTHLSWDLVSERLMSSNNHNLQKLAKIANDFLQAMNHSQDKLTDESLEIQKNVNPLYEEYKQFKEEIFSRYPCRCQTYSLDENGYRLDHLEVNDLFIQAAGFQQAGFMNDFLSGNFLNIIGRVTSAKGKDDVIGRVLENLVLSEGIQHLCTSTQYLYNADGIGVLHKVSIYLCFWNEAQRKYVEVIVKYEKVDGGDTIQDEGKKIESKEVVPAPSLNGVKFNDFLKKYYEKEYEEYIKKYRVR